MLDKKKLLDRLNKEVLFFDGAMGTQLQASGLQVGGIPEELNINQADLLVKIHEDYLKAGADFITTNTFGCNRLKMKNAKYSVRQMLEAGVRNAKQAQIQCRREKDSYIVLDIGPIGTMLKPLGPLSFDEAYEIIQEQILWVKDDVDAVLLETMTDLYEVKAGILAVKENSNLPVFVTMTFEKNGRTLTGTDTETFVNVVEGLGADMLGVNCSLGPEELAPVLEELLSYAHIPVMAQPNAGLPVLQNGKYVYKLTPEKFCESLKPFVENGLAVVGGCCGTSPDFILQEKSIMPSLVHRRENPYQTKVSSSLKTITFCGQPVVCGERLNPTGKKKMQSALLASRFEELIQEGLLQVDAGADVLDVNVGLPGLDEVQTMKTLLPLLQEVIELPLQIDSSSAAAIETACRYYNGIPVVNSVNGKEEVLKTILPIVKKYGAVVIGLTLEDEIPALAEERVKIAKKIIEAALSQGIRKENLILDCLCLTASSKQKEVQETLKTIEIIREMGYQTTLGVSNISFGLPNRPLINRTFLAMALQSGLTFPIMNPLDVDMMSCLDAFKVLSNEDPNCVSYIEKHGKEGTGKPESPAAKKTVSRENPEKTLSYIIYRGLRKQVKAQTSLELTTKDGLTVVNEQIIPALNQVGEDYEKGKIFLPQLIQSAETAKLAFEVVQDTFSESKEKKGPVLICTVEGDIHDIGKNIVKVVLESFGYEVIDLGKNVKPETVVEAWKQFQPKAIGLSALMTTTVPGMEHTISALHRENCKAPIWVGGAVLTHKIADSIGADYYTEDAMACVRLLNEII